MELDLAYGGSTLPAREGALRAQVCVVGGGIAGLLVADALARKGVDVLLVEAGGRAEATQADDATTGLGGTSRVWGGQILPVEDLSGWPVTAEALAPHWSEIEALLQTDSKPYEAEAFYAAEGAPVPEALRHADGLHARFSKFAPFARRHLGSTLGQELLVHANARVLLHATAAELLLAATGSRVDALRVLAPGQQAVLIRAEHYVLAGGTVETCRLLLQSRSVQRDGVGNDRGCVGRSLHDHVTVEAAVITGRARDRAMPLFRPWLLGGVRGTVHSLKLELVAGRSETDAERDYGMAHVTFEEPATAGAAVLRDLLRARQQHRAPSFGRVLAQLPRAVGAAARMQWSAARHHRRYVSTGARMALRLNAAQEPCAANRLQLSSQTDALGRAEAIVNWTVRPRDMAVLRRLASRFAGRFHWPIVPSRESVQEGVHWNPSFGEKEAPLTGVEDARHLMGGACMGSDPVRSVVDGNLRVHGLQNLFVASAAVLPDGRAQLPTMTVMALSLRLAEYLQTCLAREGLI